MIAQDASNVLSSVTGQEIVQALDRVPETSTVEPALPPGSVSESPLITSKFNEIENRDSILFKTYFCKNKQVVCVLFEDLQKKPEPFPILLLFQRLQFLDEACGIYLQYPRSQQTSMMVEIQTSFGVVKINCYGDVTVDKTVWNRIATANHLSLLSG